MTFGITTHDCVKHTCGCWGPSCQSLTEDTPRSKVVHPDHAKWHDEQFKCWCCGTIECQRDTEDDESTCRRCRSMAHHANYRRCCGCAWSLPDLAEGEEPLTQTHPTCLLYTSPSPRD